MTMLFLFLVVCVCAVGAVQHPFVNQEHAQTVVRVHGKFSTPLASSIQHALHYADFDVWRASSASFDIRLSVSRINELHDLFDASKNVSEYAISTLLTPEKLDELLATPPSASANATSFSSSRAFCKDIHHNALLSLFPSCIDPKEGPDLKESFHDGDRQANSPHSPIGFHSAYHTYPSIIAFLNYLAEEHSSISETLVIGKSYEDRDIIGLQISSPEPPRYGTEKLTMVISAGQHAREWISTAQTLFVAHAVLSAYSNSSPLVIELLREWDIIIIPVVNVDGYVYSWEHDRLWLKTRQDVGKGCFGVDLNHNWAYKWQPQVWENPCSDVYPGSNPFQAPELQALSELLLNRDTTAFIDMHSYGQLILYPWAHTCDGVSNAENLFEGALGAVKAIRFSHGQSYEAGSVCELSYISSGASVDWSYAAGISWSYAIESRDLGQHGYLLPATEIRPVGEETLAAWLSLASFIMAHERGLDPK